MDPDANLEEQLELTNTILVLVDTSDGDTWAETSREDLEEVAQLASELADRVAALHNWIISGGRLPKVWPVAS